MSHSFKALKQYENYVKLYNFLYVILEETLCPFTFDDVKNPLCGEFRFTCLLY